MSIQVKNVETKHTTGTASLSQIAGWLGVILGGLVCTSALGWLLIAFLIGPSTPMIVAGLIQIVGGLMLISFRWILPDNVTLFAIPIAFLVLCVNAAVGFWLGPLSLATSTNRNSQTATLSVRDTDSPVLITIEDSRGLLQNHPIWSVTMYADGKRPTQYTGWPVDLIGRNTSPTELIWHNGDPDWVEIKLDNGMRLRLTWNPAAVREARRLEDLHHFLDPKYELIR